MKKSLTFFMLASASILFGASFQTLSFEYNVEYASEEDAQTAQAHIMPFPNNKKYAFSSRWDDTNPRHIEMQKMLLQRNCKGTFYIVGDIAKKPTDLQLCKDLLTQGAAIASHTISHTDLSKVMGHVCFYQMLMERIYLESALDTSVVGFVLPNTDYKNPADPQASEIIGECFWRSGYIITPQNLNFDIDSYKIPSNKLLVHTPCFAVNDRAPDENLFKTKLEEIMNSDSFYRYKHATLGIHTWQTDTGLQTLGKIIDKYITDDFWKPNANELASYLIQYQNSKIQKLAVKGNIATFKITRISTTHLGSDIPLYVYFSKKDKFGRNILKFPPSIFHSTPKKIDHIACELEQTSSSKKFTDISATLKIKNNTLVLEMPFNKKMTNASVKFILQPNYEMPKVRYLSTNDCKTLSASAPLKLNGKYVNLFEGNTTFAVQIDFLYEGIPARIYVTTSIKQETPKDQYARDNAISSPYLSKQEYTEADIIAFSKNNQPLPKRYKWVKIFNKNNNPYTVSVKNKWNKQKDEWWFIVADVYISNDNIYEIRTLGEKHVYGLYVNGNKITDPKKVKMQKGMNRIIVNLNSLNCSRLQYVPLSVCDKERHLPLITPIMK